MQPTLESNYFRTHIIHNLFHGSKIIFFLVFSLRDGKTKNGIFHFFNLSFIVFQHINSMGSGSPPSMFSVLLRCVVLRVDWNLTK